MDKKWEVIFDYLMYLIRENKVVRGEVLPSQNMLKTKFGYSEQPIRIAFNKLIELKIVKSINGKGFVVQDKISNNLLFSFRELFPGSNNKYYDLVEIVCSKELAKVSGFQENRKLWHFKCLRKTNTNEVILYQESYILKDKFRNVTIEKLNESGLMFLIEKHSNSIISHSSKSISFVKESENEELLKNFKDRDSFNFILDLGKVYDIFGEILEFRKSWYDPKHFKWNFIEWRK
ncbi:MULTISPECIES: GntR family transcriptional regulator [unclassified Spiroplasma]|uniref:GntR family transcriptional regulator n=1 Tax=unclassified Spiroplasma TaxID=2637901 RepID=UPI0030D3000A